MKITAGMGDVTDFEKIALTGVDEIFCGFVPYEWNKKFGNISPLNRREVLYYHVNIGTYSDMKILKKMADRYGINVVITFNSLYYTKEQLAFIADMIEQLKNIGFYDFIVADIDLILYLIKYNIECNIFISGEMGEINESSYDFFVKEYRLFADKYSTEDKKTKIKRIIFNRNNSLNDMKNIITYINEINDKYKDNKIMEFEAFYLNEKCHFSGGFCNSLHCDELIPTCQLEYKLALLEKNSFELKDQLIEKYNKYLYELDALSVDENSSYNIIGMSGCGMCSLYKLNQAGITHLKIVGRGKSVDEMKLDIECVKQSIKLLDKCKSEQEFKNNVLKEIFNDKCSKNCYYAI